MQLPILSLLMAGVVSSFHPIPSAFQHFYLIPETDTIPSVNVGINTNTPEKTLHVIGSSLFENKDSNATFSNISLRKSFTGLLGIGTGKTVGAYSFQDGRASISGITTSKQTDGMPNIELVFNTTNAEGIFDERFRITEEGILNYSRDMSAMYTERSLVDKA